VFHNESRLNIRPAIMQDRFNTNITYLLLNFEQKLINLHLLWQRLRKHFSAIVADMRALNGWDSARLADSGIL